MSLNIENFFNPETSCIEINGTGNVFYDGFTFKPTGNYLLMYYKGKELGRAKLTKKSRTIKNKKEFDKLVEAAISVFDEDMRPQESVIYDLIDDVEYYISEDLNIKDVDYNNKSFIQILLDNQNDSNALVALARDMKEKFHIIRTVDDDFYYLDNSIGYFQRLSTGKYGLLVERTHGLNLFDYNIEKSLSSIKGDTEVNNYLWEFKNQYYLKCEDVNNYGVYQYNEPQLTTRKFIFNGELLEYNPMVKVMNDNPTLMERTLREILIPKSNQEDIKTYLDFLYLLGESFVIGNVSKNIITFYAPEGNNGKSLLKEILKIVHKSAYREIEPKSFRDNFFKSFIDNSNVICLDELRPDSLEKYYAELKNMTAGSNESSGMRVSHSSDYHESKGNGVFYILTNELLDIPLTDDALHYRFLIYKLANRFVDPEVDENGNECLKENEYKINLNIFNEIANDDKGLEWLVNAAIKQYKSYDFERQPASVTKEIIIDENVIRKTIQERTNLSAGTWTSNAVIVDYLLDVYEYLNNYKREEIAVRVGQELRNTYGAALETKNENGKLYKIEFNDKIKINLK